MPRPKLSDEERAKRKADRNKAYYAKKVIKNEDGEEKNYTEYLTGNDRRQVKLTLTTDEYNAAKKFVDDTVATTGDKKFTMQVYIRQLIREDLGL